MKGTKRSKVSGSKMRKGCWEPGDEVTQDDYILLQPLYERANELGFTPAQKHMSDDLNYVVTLKRRFRTWRNVVAAAGLPWLSNCEQQERRLEYTVEKSRGGDP